MFYYNTIQELSFYKLEARRLGRTELYDLYTVIGGSILQATHNVEQIVITDMSGSVEVYFSTAASKADLNNNFSETVEKCDRDPLRLWGENNTASSAYQIHHKRESDSIESQLMELDKNVTILKKLIYELESENSGPSTGDASRFIAISVMSDPVKDSSKYENTSLPVNYFCRPVEITTDPYSDSLLRLFSSMTTSDHTYEVTNCSIKKATKAVVYGSMSYLGKHTISLVGDDLKFILEK